MNNFTIKTSRIVIAIFLPILFMTTFSCSSKESVEITAKWPTITQETKPWTRWWWHGSAVNKKDLTANLEELKNAGFGGVEITPIYGVKGFEKADISFLSSEWMELFSYTLKEAERLGLGVDLANASGWPFGGPWVSAEDACKNVQFKVYSLKSGERLKEKIEFVQKPLVRAVGHKVDISEVKYPISSNKNLQELALDQVRFSKKLPLQTLMGFDEEGKSLEITDKIDNTGNLNWTAPEGNWKLYAVFQGWHGKMVERAGKGGEGNVIDHFSESATKNFLNYFDKEAKNIEISNLRAFFNDSYEVDDAQGEADWTDLMFEEFKKLRGYDLKEYLPALFGHDSDEMNSRVICDYRETISDLLLERFTKVWGDWARKYKAGIRNQAHGSPANILDLYAASDIPETEGTTPMRIKMASSAGHVSGKPIIACEAATWLNEHFLSDLSEVKQNVDRYFTHGINHIVYHGTPYSPKNEKWPGWLFYASTHFAPTNTWWEELKSINSYVANVQSFLQTSKPANDILLYFSIYDKWSNRGNSMLQHYGQKNEDLTKELSESLISKGYTFDYISDKQIQNLEVKDNKILSNNIIYKTIIIPNCEYIPLETIEKIISLGENGVNVIFENDLPRSISGNYDVPNKEKVYKKIKDDLEFIFKDNIDVSEVKNGRLFKSSDIPIALSEINIFPEQMIENGLWFNKVNRDDGICYFISNWSDQKVDKYIKINSSDKDAVIFNPMNKKYGKARIRNKTEISSEIYLQIDKGETLIVQFFSNEQKIEDYPIYQNGQSLLIDGEWKTEFINGGPTIPAPIIFKELESWTNKSEELKKFSGTARYKTSFNLSKDQISNYLLDLGEVYESAVVILNGEEVATLVGPVFSVVLESEKLKEKNVLEILVTNLMANRIIDMEKKGIEYKKFYNINVSAHLRENYINGIFSAKHWEPVKSGLVGPITLTKLAKE